MAKKRIFEDINIPCKVEAYRQVIKEKIGDTEKRILGRFEGVFGYVDIVTGNKRVFSNEWWDNAIFKNEEFLNRLKAGLVDGRNDHPIGDEEVAMNEISHIYEKFEKRRLGEKNVVWVSGVIPDTDKGRIAMALYEAGQRFGQSLRCYSEAEMRESIEYELPGSKEDPPYLEGGDFVKIPSCGDALPYFERLENKKNGGLEMGEKLGKKVKVSSDGLKIKKVEDANINISSNPETGDLEISVEADKTDALDVVSGDEVIASVNNGEEENNNDEYVDIENNEEGNEEGGGGVIERRKVKSKNLSEAIVRKIKNLENQINSLSIENSKLRKKVAVLSENKKRINNIRDGGNLRSVYRRPIESSYRRVPLNHRVSNRNFLRENRSLSNKDTFSSQLSSLRIKNLMLERKLHNLEKKILDKDVGLSNKNLMKRNVSNIHRSIESGNRVKVARPVSRGIDRLHESKFPVKKRSYNFTDRRLEKMRRNIRANSRPFPLKRQEVAGKRGIDALKVKTTVFENRSISGNDVRKSESLTETLLKKTIGGV